MDLISQILSELEGDISAQNARRKEEGTRSLSKTKISLLGQFSLLANPKVSALFSLAATVDVGALIEGDWPVQTAFKAILKKHGLHYDEDSRLVWIPPASQFETIYSSSTLICEVLSPIYTILSKAIKAKERNKILVRDAIAQFGKPLIDLIVKFGGDPSYFVE